MRWSAPIVNAFQHTKSFVKTLVRKIYAPWSIASKATGDLSQHYLPPREYCAMLLSRLRHQRQRALRFWWILNTFVTLANIATIIVAAIGLDILLSHAKGNSLTNSIPMIVIVTLVILSFFLTLVTTVYQAVMRAHVYKVVMERLQVETIKWAQGIGEYAKDERDELFHERVRAIMHGAFIGRRGDGSAPRRTLKRHILELLVSGGQND